jgi:hypothetical protein
MFNTGQVLLVLGAVLLFSMMLPSLNEAILYNDLNQIVTQVENSALALGQGILSEAATKAFDKVCLSSVPDNPDQLTAIIDLGADLGETYPGYDDLDDYGDLVLVDTTTFGAIGFRIVGSVDYVDHGDLNSPAAYPTFLKRLSVSVTSSYLIDPVTRDSLEIKLSRIYTYY